MTDFEDYGDIDAAAILYASLDEQSGRRKSVIRNLKGRVPFAFVRCVDGRNWNEEQTEAQLSEKMLERRRKEIENGRDWLTKGAIACAMTHRTNMIGMIRSSGKFCCEDDAVIQSAAIERIADGTLQATLEQLDGVTLLDYRSRRNIVAERQPVARVGNYTIHRAASGGLGSAACYYVPASIAGKIVMFQSPINVPVDHWDEMQMGGVFGNLYIIHPKAARIGDFPTTIGYAYSSHQNSLRKLLSRIVWLRRLRHFFLRRRGAFNESVTLWKDKVDD